MKKFTGYYLCNEGGLATDTRSCISTEPTVGHAEDVAMGMSYDIPAIPLHVGDVIVNDYYDSEGYYATLTVDSMSGGFVRYKDDWKQGYRIYFNSFADNPAVQSYCGGCGCAVDDRDGWTYCSGGGPDCGDRCPECAPHKHTN